MDLECYRGFFMGPKRLLVALSNYLKDEISLELLLSAYWKVIMDEMCKDIMLESWYTEEGLKLAGLVDVVESRKKNKFQNDSTK